MRLSSTLRWVALPLMVTMVVAATIPFRYLVAMGQVCLIALPLVYWFGLQEHQQERIDTYVAQGCRGAKLLQNYWGVDLNDTGLIPYFERIAAHRIPLIVHIGSEYSIESDARYERIEMLELPLACGVSVIAAHMGLGRIEYPLRFWRNLSRKPQYFDRDYFSLLEKLPGGLVLRGLVSQELRLQTLGVTAPVTEGKPRSMPDTGLSDPASLRFSSSSSVTIVNASSRSSTTIRLFAAASAGDSSGRATRWKRSAPWRPGSPASAAAASIWCCSISTCRARMASRSARPSREALSTAACP